MNYTEIFNTCMLHTCACNLKNIFEINSLIFYSENFEENGKSIIKNNKIEMQIKNLKQT